MCPAGRPRARPPAHPGPGSRRSCCGCSRTPGRGALADPIDVATGHASDVLDTSPLLAARVMPPLERVDEPLDETLDGAPNDGALDDGAEEHSKSWRARSDGESQQGHLAGAVRAGEQVTAGGAGDRQAGNGAEHARVRPAPSMTMTLLSAPQLCTATRRAPAPTDETNEVSGRSTSTRPVLRSRTVRSRSGALRSVPPVVSSRPSPMSSTPWSSTSASTCPVRASSTAVPPPVTKHT